MRLRLTTIFLQLSRQAYRTREHSNVTVMYQTGNQIARKSLFRFNPLTPLNVSIVQSPFLQSIH